MSRYYYGYFDWLCDLVDLRSQKLYWEEVLWALYTTEFEYRHPKDVNRVYDGEALRDEFWAIYGDSRSGYDELQDMVGPCSVLEALIALARRGENDIMYDPDYGDRSSKWFWMMINNLDLGQFAYRGALDIVQNREKFRDILQNFFIRKYPKTGQGGIFRDETGEIDMRKLDLWAQFGHFLSQFF